MKQGEYNVNAGWHLFHHFKSAYGGGGVWGAAACIPIVMGYKVSMYVLLYFCLFVCFFFPLE